MVHYHPIQLNKTLNYQERLPSPLLHNTVAYYWQIIAKEKDIDYLVIPDACVDIVANCTQPEVSELYFSPSFIHPGKFSLTRGETWFGIRFLPGVLAHQLRVALSTS